MKRRILGVKSCVLRERQRCTITGNWSLNCMLQHSVDDKFLRYEDGAPWHRPHQDGAWPDACSENHTPAPLGVARGPLCPRASRHHHQKTIAARPVDHGIHARWPSRRSVGRRHVGEFWCEADESARRHDCQNGSGDAVHEASVPRSHTRDSWRRRAYFYICQSMTMHFGNTGLYS